MPPVLGAPKNQKKEREGSERKMKKRKGRKGKKRKKNRNEKRKWKGTDTGDQRTSPPTGWKEKWSPYL